MNIWCVFCICTWIYKKPSNWSRNASCSQQHHWAVNDGFHVEPLQITTCNCNRRSLQVFLTISKPTYRTSHIFSCHHRETARLVIASNLVVCECVERSIMSWLFQAPHWSSLHLFTCCSLTELLIALDWRNCLWAFVIKECISAFNKTGLAQQKNSAHVLLSADETLQVRQSVIEAARVKLDQG